jgi:HEAT repeat protein
MSAHDKVMASMAFGLILGIGVLVASARCGQESPEGAPNLHMPEAVSGLTDALQDQDPSVRGAAAMALREIGADAKSAIPALAQMLRDPDGYLRTIAAHTLETFKADAVPSVVPMLGDCDPRVRALAAETLRAIGPDARAAVPALTETLHDECPSVRDAAAFALREMGPEAKSAIPALANMLCDEDEYLRLTAAQTLEKLGPDAIPAVVVMLRAPEPRVRELAANVVRQIRANIESTGRTGER